jgi:iron complex transport system substrate-binding protein
MRNLGIVLVALLLVVAGVVYFGGRVTRESKPTKADQTSSTPAKVSMRIVSTAPSITETLFALGLGDRVVGVTRFCTYPPKAKKITKIGGYIDPNFEEIVRLKPDLVIASAERTDVINALEGMNIEVMPISQRNVQSILDTISRIGQVCGVPEKTKALLGDINRRMDAVREKVSNLNRPRVLMSVGMGGQPFDKVFVAGEHSLYSDIVELAGGVNVYKGGIQDMPALSTEGVIDLNPDVIIDMVPSTGSMAASAGTVLKQWQRLKLVDAVKNNRVHVLTSDYVVIPGPRFIDALEDVAKILHPEKFR